MKWMEKMRIEEPKNSSRNEMIKKVRDGRSKKESWVLRNAALRVQKEGKNEKEVNEMWRYFEPSSLKMLMFLFCN